MTSTRHIDPEHVRLALVTLRARKLNPGIARFAAMSNGTVGTRCRLREKPLLSAPSCPPLLWPLLPSVTPSLVMRTRVHYCLAEIQRTWGTGLRALLAELDGGKA